MEAIITTILPIVRPGYDIMNSQPRYGGKETLFAQTLAGLAIGAVGFADGIDEAAVRVAAEDAMRKGRVTMIFIETPANPTNGLVDIAMVRRVAEMIGQAQGHTPIVARLRAHREMRAGLLSHGGDCDHDPRVRPPLRRHSALSTTLWRDGNSVCEDACGTKVD